MAHTTERLAAYQLFVEEGKSLKDIAAQIGVSEKSLYRWKEEDKWDDDRKTLQLTGSTALKSTLIIAVKKMEEMATSGDIDPKAADAIVKIIKAARSLSKEIDTRGNIMLGLREFTEFIRVEHPEHLSMMQSLLAEFGTWIKRKYPK